MRNPTHLTNAPAGATLVAWHNMLDAACYIVPGDGEVLVFDGRPMPCKFGGVQVIVGLAHLPLGKARKIMRKLQEGIRYNV